MTEVYDSRVANLVRDHRFKDVKWLVERVGIEFGYAEDLAAKMVRNELDRWRGSI